MVCRGLFSFPLGVNGKLCIVIGALFGYILFLIYIDILYSVNDSVRCLKRPIIL